METEAQTIDVLVHDLETILARMEGKLFGDDGEKKVTAAPPNVIDRICSSLERCKKMADHVGSQISRIGAIQR